MSGTTDTPRTDGVAETRIVKGKPRDIVDADFARQLEREAAAWRAVAEKYKQHDGDYELTECDLAFDALKSQLKLP